MKLLGTKTLETERLLLRKFNMNDAEAVFNNYGSDSNVTKYLGWKTHETLEDAKESVRYFMSVYNDNGFHWAVLIKDTNELIGDIAVNHIDKKNNNCDVGYQYGSKFWGNGYAVEALNVVLDYLLNDCEFHLVECKYTTSNVASGRVMEKAGMTKDAVLPNRRYNKYTNEYEELVIYSKVKK